MMESQRPELPELSRSKAADLGRNGVPLLN
jgi:hypothetical protein